jgi:hypothetical protein
VLNCVNPYLPSICKLYEVLQFVRESDYGARQTRTRSAVDEDYVVEGKIPSRAYEEIIKIRRPRKSISNNGGMKTTTKLPHEVKLNRVQIVKET